MKFFTKFLIPVLLVLSSLNLSVIAQDEPSKKPTRFILPLVYSQVTPPEIFTDAVISFGPFDNYTIAGTGGFCEPDIVVNYSNPLNFVATDNRVVAGSPFCFYTTNGGVSWAQVNIGGSQGDPAFASDSAGTLYLTMLSSGVRIYKSVNGGVSWSNLGNIVSNSQADKEWVAADQTGGPYRNHVYMVYLNFAQNADVQLWRSTNNATSWTGPQTIGSSFTNAGPDVATGPNGEVYIAWQNGSGSSLRKSTDGGATFNTAVFISAYTQPGTTGSAGRYVLKNDIRVNGHPKMAVDMSNTSTRGNIYVCYANNPPGPDKADIGLVRSTNGGVNWSSNLKVNDDTGFMDNWMPDVSVDNQGTVWLQWWDSRNDDPNNVMTENWAAYSTDGGQTFTNVKVSNQNFNPNIIRISQGGGEAYYLGDYQGISGKTMTFPVYTGQNNTLLDYVAYLPDYGCSFSQTSDSANPGTTSPNIMQIPMMGRYSGTITYTSSVTPAPGTGSININFNPSNVKTLTGVQDSLTVNAVVSGDCAVGTYTVAITGTETGGPRTHVRSYTLVVTTTPIGIHNQQTQNPDRFELFQNYPNPFNPSTLIDYYLPKSARVTLKVYDMLGQEVAVLINGGVQKAGYNSATFNAGNLPSGVYYYKITAGDFTAVKKMALIK